MRELNIGTKRFTKVIVVDEPGAGGACHVYTISGVYGLEINRQIDEFGTIKFQSGPIKENGVNGCHQEDLLAIVVDRLESFQAGDFACEENSLALQHIYDALECLHVRTKDRINRCVEGTNQK